MGAIGPRHRLAAQKVAAVRIRLSPFAALNDGIFEGGIRTLSPVAGFLPVRAAWLRVLNVPNPAIRTSSSLASDSAIASRTVSTAPSAVNLFRRIRAATRATIAALFIVHSSGPAIAP